MSAGYFNVTAFNLTQHSIHKTGFNDDLMFHTCQVIGNGSFGVVYQAKLCDSGEMVAIKKVLQDKRFKNRELQIMRRLDHINIVSLLYFFYTSGEKKVTLVHSSQAHS